MTAMHVARDNPAFRGVLFALATNLMWGLLPLYMRNLSHIPAMEIVAHRILWSIPVAGVMVLWLGLATDIRIALRNRKTLAFAALTAALITVNWAIYVWAVTHDRALEAALGYYINPLLSVFLGAAVLRERLDWPQLGAIALAAFAVAVLTWEAGGLPWVSLGLAVSWGAYSLLKKMLPIGPVQGFFLEVLILGLPTLAFILFLQARGEGHFTASVRDALLLAGCGVVTATPLMLFANSAKLLRLSTVGIMQYIAPTIVFFTAVFAFGEPLGTVRAVVFALIWAALAIYTWSMYFAHRR
jgi:chloramphenicol-sensitive protein RarD